MQPKRISSNSSNNTDPLQTLSTDTQSQPHVSVITVTVAMSKDNDGVTFGTGVYRPRYHRHLY